MGKYKIKAVNVQVDDYKRVMLFEPFRGSVLVFHVNGTFVINPYISNKIQYVESFDLVNSYVSKIQYQNLKDFLIEVSPDIFEKRELEWIELQEPNSCYLTSPEISARIYLDGEYNVYSTLQGIDSKENFFFATLEEAKKKVQEIWDTHLKKFLEEVV